MPGCLVAEVDGPPSILESVMNSRERTRAWVSRERRIRLLKFDITGFREQRNRKPGYGLGSEGFLRGRNSPRETDSGIDNE
jgi:hypothetical protein